MQIIIIIFLIIILWSVWGYFSSRVEKAEYVVVSKNKNYEIRKYPKHIVAQTSVVGDYNNAMNYGFRIVASYIFGANIKRESISMTAPVLSTDVKESSSSIAMTAPVVMSEEPEGRTVSFGMPKKYTLETLPIPNDRRVKIIEIPEKTFAVVKFFGYRNFSKIDEISKKLKARLLQDKVQVVGAVFYAGYNAPWTPPWMTRNEVLVEVTN